MLLPPAAAPAEAAAAPSATSATSAEEVTRAEDVAKDVAPATKTQDVRAGRPRGDVHPPGARAVFPNVPYEENKYGGG